MQQPEVNTKCGRLRGKILKSLDGIDFYAFKGIPYAQPPLGELRFKDPVPVKSWQGTRDALEYGSQAWQFDIVVTKTKGGSEDCLYLNVFSNSIDTKVRRPVMIWIHGGGFIFGDGTDLFYGPDYFMRKDVVLVTINYRLGVFGFLNLKHPAAPGNQGLKDQIMALQWVRDNIANFGGDPDNVTIFGESAGGASVHYLTLSPLAKGLFHKAISQSGVSLCPWASIPGDQKKNAMELCKRLGHKGTDENEIVKFLRTVDASKLMDIQIEMEVHEIETKCLAIFGPGSDNVSPNPFMPEPIEVAAQNGAHVPYLIGHTNREGASFLKMFEADNSYETRDKNFDNFVHPHTKTMLEKNNLTINDLRKLYFGNEKITKENSEKYIDFLSDTLFVYGIQKVIKSQVEHSSAPTYMYQFTYDQGLTIPKVMYNQTVEGATHMDDLIYLFSMKFYEFFKTEPIKKGSKDYKVMEQMIELWTNFAKTGKPTTTLSELLPVHWLPVNDGTVLRYLDIGEEISMKKTLNVEEKFSYNRV